MNVDPRTRLEVLSRAECDALLAHEHFGRLAVVVGDQPLVFPMAYALDAGDVVVRTAEGTKLHGLMGAPVAFEIDGREATYHSGWSVLVVGHAQPVTDPVRLGRLEHLPVPRWVPGDKPFWVAIRPTAVSGRRIPRPDEAAG